MAEPTQITYMQLGFFWWVTRDSSLNCRLAIDAYIMAYGFYMTIVNSPRFPLKCQEIG